MLYCFSFKNLNGNKRINAEIEEAIRLGVFIYYDKEKHQFLDANDNPVDVNNKEIIPITGVLQMEELFKALKENGAILLNSFDDLTKVKEWYKYIRTKRKIIYFKGCMLEDEEYLYYLSTIFKSDQVFLKTKEKNFNGVVDFSDFFNPESDLRKAFSYHLYDDFFISDLVKINYDEYGRNEYRVFVMKGKIMNISRIIDNVYHRIEPEVLDYVDSILNSLPDNFPTTFVIDILYSDYGFDILEFNPFEGSGKYLYNSIFSFSNDLLHDNIENVPAERKYLDISYDFVEEKLSPSTLKQVNGTFAKDLSDIERFGERIDGMVFVDGIEGKINLKGLLGSFSEVTSDKELELSTDEELFGVTQEESVDTLIKELNLKFQKDKK